MVANRGTDNAVKRSRDVLKAGWEEIRGNVKSRHLLKLRDAANLVGFVKYHVGWRWTEFELSRWSPELPYEKKLAQRRVLGIEDVEPNADGSKAVLQGICSRRAEVQQRLVRLLKRGTIRVILFNESLEGKLASTSFLCDGTLTIDVETSSVFAQDIGFDCMIDGLTLLPELEQDLPWRRRLGKYDWFQIERRTRRWIESEGCPQHGQAITKWYLGQLEGREPSKSALDELAYRLFAEYSSAE